MTCICLIPARGGSKRIPRKNIIDFHGQPMISWPIQIAKQSKLFESIYVSTDDDEIAEIAKEYGAEIPFKRPKDISNDFAADKDVLDHFIDWHKQSKQNIQYICYLYPTSPFITVDIIRGIYNTIKETDTEKCAAICEYSISPSWALTITKNNICSYDFPDKVLIRSQDLEKKYHDAGQCYFYKLSSWPNCKKFSGFKIPRLYAHDIDTPDDLLLAKSLFPYIHRERVKVN